MIVTKEDIAAWRATDVENARCDVCGWPCGVALLEPEESQMWVCHHCMWRWETNDIAQALIGVLGAPND